MSGAKQYHIRTTDEAFIADVEHEVKRTGVRQSEGAAVLALAQEGLLYRRWKREQEAYVLYLQKHEGAPEAEHDQDEVEQAHGADQQA